ncbi:MAG: serine--tRNA ligase, partial [Candidatus Omnitrophota bacterium]
MLDLTFIRENSEKVRAALKIRAPRIDFDAFLELDVRRRACLGELEALRAEKNKANERISDLLKEKKDPQEVIASMKSISQKIGELDGQAAAFEDQIRQQLLFIPNIAHASVPEGADSSQNRQVHAWGQPRQFDFKPKDHIELGQTLGLFDLECAVKLSGSGYILFKGAGARLERALINFMLDVHTQEHGYLEFSPPFMVQRASMIGTGQVPKFEEDMYRLKDEDLFLIPTAEVPITNIHRDETLAEDQLPLKYTAY